MLGKVLENAVDIPSKNPIPTPQHLQHRFSKLAADFAFACHFRLPMAGAKKPPEGGSLGGRLVPLVTRQA